MVKEKNDWILKIIRINLALTFGNTNSDNSPANCLILIKVVFKCIMNTCRRMWSKPKTSGGMRALSGNAVWIVTFSIYVFQSSFHRITVFQLCFHKTSGNNNFSFNYENCCGCYSCIIRRVSISFWSELKYGRHVIWLTLTEPIYVEHWTSSVNTERSISILITTTTTLSCLRKSPF